MQLRFAATILTLVLAGLTVNTWAQNPTSGSDRLSLSFVEDATQPDSQWWEGQFEYADGEAVDAVILRGIFTAQFFEDVEIGGRVGFGDTDTDTPSPLPNGSGATDLDVWGKYHLGSRNDNTEFSIGAIATIPTGDEQAGLGFDAFSVKLFGAARHRLDKVILTGNVGVRFNGDATMLGSPEIEGETSIGVGAGAIFPLSDGVTLVAEATIEGERFDGADEDIRVLGGVNWRFSNRGQIRGAIAFGLTDAAPDAQALAGVAFQF